VDSLNLFTPAQYDGLPGMPFPAPADTYPTKDGSARVIRLNQSGGSSVLICRGLGLRGAHRCEAGQDMSSQLPATGSLRRFSVSHRTLMAWRLLSAIMLLIMGGIHLYLVFYGVGGLLGVLFVLNAVGALVLAIAVIVLRGRLLSLATVLSLLFIVGTLLALGSH
jgi:hypothetical protein